MKKEEWYIISDLKNFIDYTRTLVFNAFGDEENNQEKVDSLIDKVKPNEQKELDTILSYNESEIIVKSLVRKQISKKNQEIRFIITDSILHQIIEELNNRMVSNILNQLASKGLIETAYDENINDFVFWVKDNNIGETNE